MRLPVEVLGAEALSTALVKNARSQRHYGRSWLASVEVPLVEATVCPRYRLLLSSCPAGATVAGRVNQPGCNWAMSVPSTSMELVTENAIFERCGPIG